MSTSPVPEHLLTFSPTLAETIGLEEAILLQFLDGLSRHPGLPGGGRDPSGVRARPEDLHAALPFWKPDDIRRIQDSLEAKGMISVTPGGRHGAPLIAIAELSAPADEDALRPAAARPEERWEPDEELVRLCVREHGIPEDFARGLARPFNLHWSERARNSPSARGASCEFLAYARKRWREEETRLAAIEAAAPMPLDWEPAQDTVGLLTEGGVSAGFVATELPMFRIYWRGRGERRADWDGLFVERVRCEWEKELVRRPLPENWEPDGETVEFLESEGVPGRFIRGRVAVFRSYWRETRQRKRAWNHAFRQWVMKDWMDGRNGPDSSGESDEEAVKKKLAQYADRSWAVD